MLSDYTDRDFKGKVYFSKFNPGAVLGVGESGIVEAINAPTFQYQEFTQQEPSTSWSIRHDFGIVPFVMVLRENGKDITSAVEIYKNEETVRIETDGFPLTGKVILCSLGFSVGGGDSGGIRWVVQNASGNLEINSGYTVVESQEDVVELTLPPSAQPGNSIQIVGENDWKIKQNNGQSIRFGSQISTEGVEGYLKSTSIGDCVTITCSRTNFAWSVTSSQGNLTIA